MNFLESRRQRCLAVLLVIAVLKGDLHAEEKPSPEKSKQTLYNGIELPQQWPPRIKTMAPAHETDPVVPAYLQKPPAVIPIDVGRQLLVDDFLIEDSNLKRSFYALKPYNKNPILVANQPWEFEGKWTRGDGREFQGPYAMPFSDGVWYDPADKLFKMWYMGGLLHCTCYATSRDGLNWEKPELDVVAGTNIVHAGNRDSASVWLDLDESDPERRFKLFRYEKNPIRGNIFALHFSPDGIHWSKEIRQAGPAYDRTTAFYNPFRKVWVYSLKSAYPKAGAPDVFPVRRYWEADDLVHSPMWPSYTSPLLWTNTDRLDVPLLTSGYRRAFIYNLDVVAYESVMLGLFTLHQRTHTKEGRPKKNEVFVGFSRDGFSWDRPWRKPFVSVSDKKGAWNWGNVQSVGGCCLIVGDKLHFYYSGRAGTGRLGEEKSFYDADGSTGVGFLRRDGFASLDAGPDGGAVLTRPISFKGRYLFVNTNARGRLLAEVLDQHGKVIEGFSKESCIPVTGDKTLAAVSWENGADLSDLAGKAVQIRFHITDGELYSFWVSPDKTGASYGYVAAGGPGFTSSRDTVGRVTIPHTP
jgi:hypothetical protein